VIQAVDQAVFPRRRKRVIVRGRGVTMHFAVALRRERKTGRDSDGTAAEDCSEDITDDSDIVFIVENASRRFSSRP
jgi:hypothetical protein